jgi:hypothetical protein
LAIRHPGFGGKRLRLNEPELVAVHVFELRPHPPRLLGGFLGELYPAASQLLESGPQIIAFENYIGESSDAVFLSGRGEQYQTRLGPAGATSIQRASGLMGSSIRFSRPKTFT